MNLWLSQFELFEAKSNSKFEIFNPPSDDQSCFETKTDSEFAVGSQTKFDAKLGVYLLFKLTSSVKSMVFCLLKPLEY